MQLGSLLFTLCKLQWTLYRSAQEEAVHAGESAAIIFTARSNKNDSLARRNSWVPEAPRQLLLFSKARMVQPFAYIKDVGSQAISSYLWKARI